jgi:cell division initiation protein
MKIAPIDIAHKTFTRKVMGLDADEVADFLRDVADQMEEIIRERNSLKEMIRQRDLQIMEYKERDEGLKATIQTATKMSEQIRIDAEREAKLIIGDAQQKSEMILKDSRDSLKRVYQEIADIKRLRMQFEVNMRSLVQAHIAMLDQGHLTMPDPQINLAHAVAVAGGAPMNSASGGAGNAGNSGVSANHAGNNSGGVAATGSGVNQMPSASAVGGGFPIGQNRTVQTGRA